MSTGLAHLLQFGINAGSQLGGVWLFRGIRNLCNMQDWAAANRFLIDRVNMADYNYAIGATSHRVDLRPTTANQQTIRICYQPDGSVLTSLAGGRFSFGNDAVLGSNVEFAVTRRINNAQQGPQRLVLFTAGGTVRLAR